MGCYCFFPSMFQHSAMSNTIVRFFFHSHIFEEQQNKEYKYFDKTLWNQRTHTHSHKIATAKTKANMKWKKHEIRSNWYSTHMYEYIYFFCVSTPSQAYMAIVRLNDCEKFSKVVFYSDFYSFDVNLSSLDVGCAWRAHRRNDFVLLHIEINLEWQFSEKWAILNHPANGIIG